MRKLRAYLLRTTSALAIGIAVAACSQSSTDQTVTLQQVQDTITKTCSYVPTISSIAAVGATIASAINPAAGGAATVLVTTGDAIAKTICDAVKAQQAAVKGTPMKAGDDFSVIVNGVEVHGKLTESKT